MERELSDEDDDRENLIDSNERKNPRSTFEIAGIKSKIGSSWSSSFSKKRYLIAICLPLLLICVYFSVDIGNSFRSVSSVRIESSNDLVREAELKALYLLREQQLELLNVWNRTLRRVDSKLKGNMSSNSSSEKDDVLGSLRLFEDYRDTLLKQIRVNKEIQQVLLSSHRVGNVSNLAVDGNAGMGLGGYSGNQCRKVARVLEKRTLEWNPKKNKYLFAICVSGQMSNHLICLEKHMFFAAVLNRILVIPSSKVDYPYNRVLDIIHINTCFERKVVISFEEFSEIKKNHIHIDKLICYVSLPQSCYVDDEHVKKLKSFGVTMGKLEPAWVEDIKEPKKRTMEDIAANFSTNDEVLAVGDVFYADVQQEWVMQPGGPLAHKCKTLIEPSRLIMLTAQRFIQTFLGKSFIALHFRRHGFLKFCNAKKPSCFYPVPQAADCITRLVERANAPVIYLSTDAAESETDLLQSLIVINGKVVPLVKRPARNSAEKWDALLFRHGLEGDAQVEAMLDKTICAMSSVFIGASGSTFTEDILRLRKDWGSASVCDEYLCQNEQPNFIAENE
ncbi:hypothetical protein GIB67_041238 [Kingdonia uniflora]|uniref:GDP-fucose protein O-fucosyltransferase 2 n=1 Tax=Kingdonia uniflora TaxID=39325 RepID=A0A7J7MGM1_9MAGN|nr:hypothetical protein GIB67_041238 [Kingdonia uniflora]